MKYHLALLTALVAFCSCAKLMEDQPPGADSTQVANDSTALDTNQAKATGTKVPERFLQFFYREFTGTASTTTGRVHSLTVETIMDVTIAIKPESSGLIFSIKKDGLDITEEPTAKWQGRLVPGKYMIAVLPSPQANRTQPIAYSITVKEE